MAHSSSCLLLLIMASSPCLSYLLQSVNSIQCHHAPRLSFLLFCSLGLGHACVCECDVNLWVSCSLHGCIGRGGIKLGGTLVDGWIRATLHSVDVLIAKRELGVLGALVDLIPLELARLPSKQRMQICISCKSDFLHGIRASPPGRPIFVSESVRFDLFGSAHGHQIGACLFRSGVNPAVHPKKKAPKKMSLSSPIVSGRGDDHRYPSASPLLPRPHPRRLPSPSPPRRIPGHI
jgi:hypothetical protein